ncbi:MAG: HlyD family secretion protein [Bacteroidia bacterium]
MIENKHFSNSIWTGKIFKRIITITAVVIILVLFFPWTQNIQSTGVVTTLRPDERPQEIQTLIPGRITKWFVKDGDMVEEGDTIAVLTEIKSDYLNPDLIGQTSIQIKAKENSIVSYSAKVDAINKQITQMEANRDFVIQKAKVRLEQENLQYAQEVAEYQSAEINMRVTKQQLDRDSILGTKQIKSPVDIENRRINYQTALAKKLIQKSKMDMAKNAIENAKIELQNISVEYGEKLAKLESERFSAISAQMDTESEVSKLRNEYSNYQIRNGFYIIKAPQSGLVSQTLSNGVGITVKEGQALCTIVPSNVNLAVELFVSPVDMPLITKGVDVQIIFDGWPTMVFSGWPELTFGTFPGKVYAIDNALQPSGKYRVLVRMDPENKKWPTELKIGVGARSYMLLKRVPIWYEIWRLLSGFPADYYHQARIKQQNEAKK